MAEKEELKGMDAKGMITDAVKDKKVIKYNDRKKVEILENTRFYKKGQIIEPHSLMANQLIKDKIAKEVK